MMEHQWWEQKPSADGCWKAARSNAGILAGSGRSCKMLTFRFSGPVVATEEHPSPVTFLAIEV